MALNEPEKQSKTDKQRGGRPRNAWTRSRIRRACKLYTFTSLKMVDIVKTLEAPGFSPKKRNVETKIFNVLAKIPNRSRTENSRLLNNWRELRKCRQLRRKRSITVSRLSSQISKPPQCVGLSACPKGARTLSQNPSKDAQQTESHGAESPTESVYLAHTRRPAIPIDLIYPKSGNIDMKDIPEKSTRITEQVMSICNSSSSSDRSSMVSWISSLASRGSSIMENRGSRSAFQSSSIISQDSRPEQTCHVQEKPRSLQRIQASYEPNFTTDSSSNPSLLSSAEQEVWNQLIDEEALGHALYQTSELCIWRRLKRPLAIINMAFAPFNCQCESCESYHFTDMILPPFSCQCDSCESIHYGAPLSESRICSRCGSSLMHRICRDFGYTLQGMEINYRDYFDNSALHYLAERAPPNFREIRRLILNGYDPRSRNTSGATFLHVLNWKYVWKLQHTQYAVFGEFIDMVESLSTWNFNFNDRDCFGRTVAHKAFSAQATMNKVDIRISIVEQILSVLKTNIFTQDTFGVTVNVIIHELEDRICDTRISGVVGESVLTLLTHYYNETIPQDEILVHDFDHFLLTEGCDIPHERASSVDTNGDTLLFRALKVGDRMPSEKLLEMKIRDLLKLGSNIHQRNRDGDTVLSAAISQGLTIVVNLLLSEGANPNSEQFHIFHGSDKSQSLLCRAEIALARAKRKHNSSRYAGILSCIKLVTEAGAVATPSLLQKWGNRTIRERIAREGEAFDSGRASI